MTSPLILALDTKCTIFSGHKRLEWGYKVLPHPPKAIERLKDGMEMGEVTINVPIASSIHKHCRLRYLGNVV